jgi:oligoendopeptidase F
LPPGIDLEENGRPISSSRHFRKEHLLVEPARTIASVFSASSSPSAPAVTPDRSGVNESLRWRLSDIFADEAAWGAEMDRLPDEAERLSECRGTLGDGPGPLCEVLSRKAELESAIDTAYVWAHLLRDEDTRATGPQGMADRVARLAVRVAEAGAFVEPEILALPDEQLQTYLGAEELSPWRHYLENLVRLREHMLSSREEELLASAGELSRVPNSAFGMLNDADLRFDAVPDSEGEEHEVTPARYPVLMENPDRVLREGAWNSLMRGYEAHRNTLAALLGGAVKRDVFYSRARGYSSCLAAALHSSNIPEGVFHTLLDSVAGRAGAMHRYVAQRKRLLGVDELHPHDMFVPLGDAPSWEVRWEDAGSILREGLAPLGEEYGATMAHGISGGGWVDVLPTRGKRSGAYSWGAWATHPFVLMNYQGTLDHLFTLAHEMGHAVHHHYTSESQPYAYSHTPIFLAEVASTTNEVLLMEHLLATTEEPDRRFALLNQYLDQLRGTVFHQVIYARFEHEVHCMAEEGRPLTHETLGGAFGNAYRDMMGPELAFGERAAAAWSRIPHFYTGYYVYQYATGFSAAVALSRRILSGGPSERQAYLDFLAAGDSDYPIETLRRAGVDLAGPEAVTDTLDLFETLLDRLDEHVERHGVPGRN